LAPPGVLISLPTWANVLPWLSLMDAKLTDGKSKPTATRSPAVVVEESSRETEVPEPDVAAART